MDKVSDYSMAMMLGRSNVLDFSQDGGKLFVIHSCILTKIVTVARCFISVYR